MSLSQLCKDYKPAVPSYFKLHHALEEGIFEWNYCTAVPKGKILPGPRHQTLLLLTFYLQVLLHFFSRAMLE